MEKLEEDLRRKDKEMNETVNVFDKILISAEEKHNALTLKMEGVIAEKDNILKCLKTDLEEISGSYKRIEIQMEEMKSGFKKSIEKMQKEHLDEVASLKETNENT